MQLRENVKHLVIVMNDQTPIWLKIKPEREAYYERSRARAKELMASLLMSAWGDLEATKKVKDEIEPYMRRYGMSYNEIDREIKVIQYFERVVDEEGTDPDMPPQQSPEEKEKNEGKVTTKASGEKIAKEIRDEKAGEPCSWLPSEAAMRAMEVRAMQREYEVIQEIERKVDDSDTDPDMPSLVSDTDSDM